MEAVVSMTPYNRLPQPQKERQIPQWLMPLVYNWKKILLFTVIICLLFGGLAFCANWQDDLNSGEMVGIHKTVLSKLDDIFGANSLDEAKELLQITKTDTSVNVAGYSINITGALNTVNAIFVNIGTCWLLICWGASFFDMLVQNNNQMILEQMIRKFIYLIIGIALVQNAMDITFAVAGFGTDVLNAISATSAAGTADLDAVKQVIYDDMTGHTGILGGMMDWIAGFGYLIDLLIPWLAAMICNLVVSFTCWSRFVEICIIATVSPVMFADIGDDRGGLMHSGAMRAFKQILALALSGTLIFASLYISNMIAASMMAGVVIDGGSLADSCWKQVIIGLVRVGLCSKASSIAKQIVGLA